MQNMPTPPAYARSPRMPLHRRHTISSGASPKKKKKTYEERLKVKRELKNAAAAS